MKVKLKICGMREPKNIISVSDLQPDFMGFIFYPGSPRCVQDGFQMPALPASTQKVGVFVNEPDEQILNVVRNHLLDFVQLHGHETVVQCERLRKNNLRIIKAFSVDQDFDFNTTKPFESVVDYFLFDTKGKLPGGNGLTFNWQLLENYNQSVPFFLSGGLSPENIGALSGLRNMNLFAVDVNSGVETEPGLKDISRIKALKSEILKTVV